ncbi:MAG: ATP-binding cassette domain-containing protein [Mogibacterium sp.]|nr:ATP-binding cassette domain-containing protein [Mogibacterium sp.]
MGKAETAIRVRHVSKSYRQYKTNMQKIGFLLLKRDTGIRTDVLQDISFDIKKGEKVGIIGRQQSGKTTLMRIIAGVIRPDSGKVKISGGLTSILEVRLGFDAAMTGLDNYKVMTTALGWSSEMIKEHEDSVFEFAKLTDEKDETLRSYKKGAPTRLGFAIATEMGNDIYLYDGPLSFGSKIWNKICINRLLKLIDGDTTFVMSVNKLADGAKLCGRGIVIHEGELVFDGPYADAVDYFRKNCRQSSRKKETEAMNEEVEAEQEDLSDSDEENSDDM